MLIDPSGGPNSDEARYWASPSGLSWIENEAELDTLMAPVTEAVYDMAGLAPGMRVLDIGCGTGAHSFAAARRAGTGGEVVAVDISPPLLARAKDRAASMTGGARVTFINADAQTVELPPREFDLATSRFGVMFFAEPATAFMNISRSIRRGGRMLFAAWAPVSVNPWWRIPGSVAGARLGTPPPSEPNAPGPMGLSDIGYVSGELSKAGFEDFRVTAVNVGLHHPAGAAAMAALSLRVGPAARAMRLFDGGSADAAAIEQALAAAYAPYEVESGFVIPATINMIDVLIP